MAPPGIKYFGLWRDLQNARYGLYYAGTAVLRFTASAITVIQGITFSGTALVTGVLTATATAIFTAGLKIGPTGAGIFSLGTAEPVTIASGIATVTRPLVVLDAEGAGTTDTLDSIVKAGQTAGELLLLLVTASDTITADNSSTLILGGATRAIAPGGSLLLIATSATVWQEVAFLTAAS